MAIGNKTGVVPISDAAGEANSASSQPPINQLRWRCRRGMLELDVMLRRFLDQRFETLTHNEQTQFVQLLDLEDDQLWDWLSGRFTPEDTPRKNLIEQIRRLPSA